MYGTVKAGAVPAAGTLPVLGASGVGMLWTVLGALMILGVSGALLRLVPRKQR